MNYVLWIQDIVNAHARVLDHTTAKAVRGIDIGTGASAIYPILATALEPGWEMVATEIDDRSFDFAQRNLKANDLEKRIRLRKAEGGKSILFPLNDATETFSFTMCNPPFYASQDEILRSKEGKELPPSSVCTGAETEMIYPGGEAEFVGQMVRESERFRTRCKWYTSMLGKLSSVSRIVLMLKERSITNYAITQFVQGQTRRWAVGWSYTDTRLPDSTARIPLPPMHSLHPLLPLRNTLAQRFPKARGRRRDEMEKAVVSVLEAIEGVAVSMPGGSEGEGGGGERHEGDKKGKEKIKGEEEKVILVQANGNTWSRSARRKRKIEASIGTGDTSVPQGDGGGGRPQNSKVDNVLSPSSPRKDTSRKDDGEVSTGPALVCSIRWLDSSRNDGGGSAGAGAGEGDSAYEGEEGANIANVSANTGEPGTGNGNGNEKVVDVPALEIQWIYGHDRPLFESFVSHVGRKLAGVLG